MGEFLKRLALVFALCFALSMLVGTVSPSGDVLCYKNSCENVTCPKVNCTNGTLLTSPSYACGCCKTCFQYLSKDEPCSDTSNDRMCGPGLTCANVTKGTGSCMRKNTTCILAQDEYDEKKQKGTIGMYVARPECDSEGEFVPRICTPGGTCFCIDKTGKRIFGEGLPDAALTGDPMDCQCSRDYHDAQGLGAREPIGFLHCLPNGNYDKLQCIGQACFCMNPDDQSSTSPFKPITNAQDLSCFNKEMHYYNYFRPCERERMKARNLRFSYNRNNITVLSIELPTCTPDGYYHPVRHTESNLYCADPVGDQIEDFSVEINSPSATTMNCNCARARYWLESQKTSKPICCKNGNYRSIQCKGGVCFCVDDNGNQVGIEVLSVNATSLKCSNPTSFPDC